MFKNFLAKIAVVLVASLVVLVPDRAAGEESANSCQPGFAWLGDNTSLAVSPGDRIGSIEELLSQRPGSPAGWTERARIRTDLHTLVVLEWPGNSAALVVLATHGSDFCVVTGWGFSFGGLGVELSIADIQVPFYRALPELIVLESIGTYNTPPDDPTDPTDHRRTVIAIGPTRAAVIADTQRSRFTPLARWHWFLEQDRSGTRLRMTLGSRFRSFRIDLRTWWIQGGRLTGESSESSHRPRQRE